ncbi:MAG: UDP-3-O-(3-hydroxymyristoyl)glucosamine N-acyltransferase [Nitrospirae bacterium]|nr:MAG: UDP-3-O-(3-hydroxymyristoyl)glucosamine N-acyltransferase [Nitrospirota bacterium]
MTWRSHNGIPIHVLAQAVQGQLSGPGEVMITGVSSLEGATSGDLAFVAKPNLVQQARRSKAGALIVAQPLPGEQRPQIVVSNPLYAFAVIASRYFTPPPPARGIASEAVFGSDVCIGPEVSIGPFVTLGDRARIGARVTLYPGVYLGEDTVVGDDTVLYPHVTVLRGCVIGARVTIHAGTVIGSDGFGYVQHQGKHQKIPQLGNVVIEDDVELGAHVTVDRATFGSTIVKRGTKVDNQVQIAHNVVVGEDCILVAQVGIAGSTTLGHHVMIGGQAGLVDHLHIGDFAKIAAGSGVTSHVSSGQIVGGRPAVDHATWLKSQVLVHKLPEMRKELRELRARLDQLEEQLAASAKKKA